MPNWLSITWENDRMLILFAKTQNGSIVAEQIQTLETPPNHDDTGGESSNLSIKKRLMELVRDQHWARSETAVILSRNDVEVRPMVFPPVPVGELPDLVRFQATKEFNGYDVHSPLDYMITNKLENVSRSTLFPAIKESDIKKSTKNGAEPESPKHVLASTIRPASFQNIQELCESCNLVLKRVVLRPCETASLWRRSPQFDPIRTTLLVELDAGETSQVVLYQGEPIFMRSPKISCPGDVGHPDFAARLIAELKRTRIAVRNELQGVTVDEIALCGVGPGFDSLVRQVSVGMGIPVKTFDPWRDITCGSTVKAAWPTTPERFAPLIGTTLRAAKGEASDIDFCSPKKRIEPAGKRNLITGIVAALILTLVGLTGYGLLNRSSLTREVRTLSAQKEGLKKKAKIVSDQRARITTINAWLVDNVNWFEQLDWLSRMAPRAKDMYINDLTLSANNGGAMTLKSLVKDASVISPMEERMRDEKHLVKAGEKGEVQGSPGYGFRYNLSVFLSKESAASSVGDEPKAENGGVPSETDSHVDKPSEPSTAGPPPVPPAGTIPDAGPKVHPDTQPHAKSDVKSEPASKSPEKGEKEVKQ